MRARPVFVRVHGWDGGLPEVLYRESRASGRSSARIAVECGSRVAIMVDLESEIVLYRKTHPDVARVRRVAR